MVVAAQNRHALQGEQGLRRGMAVVVRPHRDQGRARAAGLVEGGHHPSGTVMRHLQHIGGQGRRPLLEQLLLRLLLRLAGVQDRLGPVACAEHDRVVVRVFLGSLHQRLGRPQQLDHRVAEPVGQPGARAIHRHPTLLEQRAQPRVLGQLVVDHRVERARDRQRLGDPDQADHVVGVRMADGEQIDPVNAFSPESAQDRRLLGPAVDQHRAPPGAQHDRLALSDVEHGDHHAVQRRGAERARPHAARGDQRRRQQDRRDATGMPAARQGDRGERERHRAEHAERAARG